MKKIIFFMLRFSGGGAEKMTIFLANELKKLDYDITFVVRENRGETKYLLDPSINIIDLQLTMKSKLIKNGKNIVQLRNLFLEDYDICFGVSTSMSLIAAISNFFANNQIKVISVIHNTISNEKRSFSKLRNYLIKLFDKYTTKTVVVSKDAAIDYIETCKINKHKVVTIYNPVISEKIFNLCKIDPQHKWLTNKRDFKVIINAGRLSYQKNHELLINTLKKVREDMDVRLIILGIGELEIQLKKLCESLNITDYVDFVGYTNNPYAYFSKSDMFVLSSRYEGLPTVLIEALACGCKVVSTDCPSGPREILNEGEFGVLAESTVQSLAKAIKQSLTNDENKQRLKKYSTKFSVEKSLEKYVELIESI